MSWSRISKFMPAGLCGEREGMTEADCGNDASGVGDSLVVVAAIGEDISHEGIKCAGSAEEGDETVAALNARGMQLGCERTRTARHD